MEFRGKQECDSGSALHKDEVRTSELLLDLHFCLLELNCDRSGVTRLTKCNNIELAEVEIARK